MLSPQSHTDVESVDHLYPVEDGSNNVSKFRFRVVVEKSPLLSGQPPSPRVENPPRTSYTSPNCSDRFAVRLSLTTVQRYGDSADGAIVVADHVQPFR